jgi:N utilization substance protein B
VHPEPREVTEYARELVTGVEANRGAIDAVIGQAAPQFPVGELAAVDRNILRVAIYEVLFDNETPSGAAVNEAVELAKTFGGESSPRFVNGVLRTVSARAAH